jgi:hypothetical protein
LPKADTKEGLIHDGDRILISIGRQATTTWYRLVNTTKFLMLDVSLTDLELGLLAKPWTLTEDDLAWRWARGVIFPMLIAI